MQKKLVFSAESRQNLPKVRFLAHFHCCFKNNSYLCRRSGIATLHLDLWSKKDPLRREAIESLVEDTEV